MIIDSPIISGSTSATGSLNQVGNVTITGSLTVTGAIIGAVTGSVDSASFSQTAISSSYAASATSASYAVSATSSSFATTAISSSYPLAITGSTIYSVRPSTSQLNPSNTIALGDSAGYQASGAYSSNFLGDNAGNGATNAYNSNIFGRDAGRGATNASYANYLGNGAGYGAIYASDSNFLGTNAGFQATSAQYSNFIGSYAGFGAANATYGIFIGLKAGHRQFGSGVGTNNIIIGNNITLDDSRVGTVNIGAVLFATGSYANMGASNAFAGAMTTGRVGVNNAYPVYNLDVSGSGNYTNGLTVTGSLVATSFTGSLLGTASYAANANLLDGLDSTVFVPTGSFNTFSSSILTYTGSNDTNISNIHSTTASLNTFTGSATSRLNSIESTTGSLNAASGSAITRLNAIEVVTGSNISRLSSLESKTGSYATTGSNTFVDGQYISASFNPTGFTTTASLYTDGGLRVGRDAYISGTLYLNNVTVYGTQSVCFITSSQLNISSNIISVNTATPSVRFGGLAVYDSGSTGLTGSILWDSQDNQWIYSNPSGSAYDSAMFLVGPRNSGTLGNEVGIECNFLSKGNGMHHMTSSAIFDDGSRTCFYGTSIITSTGVGCFSGAVCASSVASAGTVTGTSAAFSSTLSSDGNFTVNTNRFTVSAATGNTSVAGTLNVTGQACASSILSSGTICSTGNNCFGGMSIVASCLGVGTATPNQKLQVYDATVARILVGTNTTFTDPYSAFPAQNISAIQVISSNVGGAQLQLGYTNTCSGCGIGGIHFMTTGTSASEKRGALIASELEASSATNVTANLVFYTNITGTIGERMRIASTGQVCFACTICAPMVLASGCVGIGTTAPGSPLEIYSSNVFNTSTGANPHLIINYNSATAGGPAIKFSRVGISDWSAIQADLSGGTRTLKFIQTASGVASTQMVINANDGNVGIGTTSPCYKLDVSADINDGSIIRAVNLNSGAAATARFYAENNIGSLGQLTTYSSGFGFTVFGLAAGNYTALLSSGVSSAGLLIGSLTSSPVIFGTNSVERLRISANGTACFACDLTAKSLGTNDLILNNLNHEHANYVDGTRGSWLIQEGACDLFIINQVSCKKYKFNLIEIE